MLKTDDLDFDLPPELIAQSPSPNRDGSRLLHYSSASQRLEHRLFSDLPALLHPGDLLVFNNARVIPARFTLRKATGGRVEALFLHSTTPGIWRIMLKNLGKRHDIPLHFDSEPSLSAAITAGYGAGEYDLRITDPTAPSPDNQPASLLNSYLPILNRVGRIPLPPYIHRNPDHDPRDAADAQRYQTVYAAVPGSVAAPTAGLHFTPQLLEALKNKGVEQTFITLHVGAGTFKPVTVDRLDQHPMHHERYEITPDAAAALNRAKSDHRRIIAVGTTATRVLESQPADKPFCAMMGDTDLFIYPPYHWKHIGALITNFHLPRSTLIALVAARIGLETQRHLYQTAIAQRYRFFSYGDAMFLE